MLYNPSTDKTISQYVYTHKMEEHRVTRLIKNVRHITP